MGAAAKNIFAMGRCDPAEILAVLDEVEAQFIVGNIKSLPTSGGNAEQVDLDLFARCQIGQIIIPIVFLKEVDAADLLALISADGETVVILKTLLQRFVGRRGRH